MRTDSPAVRSVLWAFLAAALLIPLALVWRNPAPPPSVAREPLGDFGEVPEFRLIERDGREIMRKSLLGTPWVADFIYTRCPGPCPLLSARMAALSKQLEDREARLVSFSVDPAFDTPERLREYAQAHAAPDERWWFLTGETDEMRRVIRDGFRLAVAETTESNAAHGPITHSTRVALIDEEGRIRRYYLGEESGFVDEVLLDLDVLERE